MRKIMALLPCMALAGCTSLKVIDTAGLNKAQLAQVSGDHRLRSGAPVNVFLRSVDGVALKLWQHSADVEAGLHRLLVDCAVTATDKLSRHVLNVALEAGVHYRLQADANDRQGCTRVELVELN